MNVSDGSQVDQNINEMLEASPLQSNYPSVLSKYGYSCILNDITAVKMS